MGGKNGAPFGNRNQASRWNPPAGVKRRGVRLNEDQVGRMRRAFEAGTEHSLLRERFGVSKRTIWQVLTRRTWKNVP